MHHLDLLASWCKLASSGQWTHKFPRLTPSVLVVAVKWLLYSTNPTWEKLQPPTRNYQLMFSSVMPSNVAWLCWPKVSHLNALRVTLTWVFLAFYWTHISFLFTTTTILWLFFFQIFDFELTEAEMQKLGTSGLNIRLFYHPRWVCFFLGVEVSFKTLLSLSLGARMLS